MSFVVQIIKLTAYLSRNNTHINNRENSMHNEQVFINWISAFAEVLDVDIKTKGGTVMLKNCIHDGHVNAIDTIYVLYGSERAFFTQMKINIKNRKKKSFHAYKC